MSEQALPFEKVLFVCTHQRQAGERIACANPGRLGQILRDELKKKVKESGWEGAVRVCASGCLDKCEEGPNAVLVPSTGDPQWWNGLDLKDIPTLLSRLTPSSSPKSPPL